MKCWVSKWGIKGVWSSFLKEFVEMKIFGLTFFKKGQNLRPFSGLAPLKLKLKKNYLMVAYVHIK